MNAQERLIRQTLDKCRQDLVLLYVETGDMAVREAAAKVAQTLYDRSGWTLSATEVIDKYCAVRQPATVAGDGETPGAGEE